MVGSKLSDMDTDKDGKISRAEYMARYEKRFDTMDTNDDGYLTQQEMKETATTAVQKGKEKAMERAGARFDEMDLDKDGKVTLDEYKSSNPSPTADQGFARLDSNGDGYLTTEEMQSTGQEMKSKFKEKRRGLGGFQRK